MARYSDVDLTFTNSGDLALTENGDLSLSAQTQRLREQIAARIKTQLSDWLCYPATGTTLEDLIGLPNTKLNAENGKNSIVKALTYDGLVNEGDINILILPLKDKILYKIKVKTGFSSEVFLEAIIDFNLGIEVI